LKIVTAIASLTPRIIATIISVDAPFYVTIPKPKHKKLKTFKRADMGVPVALTWPWLLPASY
jgi:hypothetical protein